MHKENHPRTSPSCTSDSKILEELTPILRDVFFDDELVASADLTADKVLGWDSIGHVRLIVAIESRFGIRFHASEISALRNLGQLAELILRKRPEIP